MAARARKAPAAVEAGEPAAGEPAAVERRLLDIDSFSVAEVAAMERASGLSFATIIRRMADKDAPKAEAAQALLFLLERKENPKVTFEEVGAQQQYTTVQLEIGAPSREVDPTPSPSGTAEASST